MNVPNLRYERIQEEYAAWSEERDRREARVAANAKAKAKAKVKAKATANGGVANGKMAKKAKKPPTSVSNPKKRLKKSSLIPGEIRGSDF